MLRRSYVALLLRRRGALRGDAEQLLGNEWRGLAIDFLTNTYAISTATNAETLLGTGPDTIEDAAFALDFTDNSSAVRR